MPSATSQIHSTVNKYVSSIIHALLIMMLKPLLEPLEMVNIELLLMWKIFELLFFFLDYKITLKLPQKKSANVVESYDSKENDDEDESKEVTNEEVDEENDEDDSEEDIENDEDESTANKGEDFAQGMNYPPRINKHIKFSSTSSSAPSADVVV
ncbi:unnamed protein product [Lactuca saligna]|uniref:Uncharacterized protein n=1 Tax=Lactuca saligna TaxID=75948 RepID=A0AA36EHZ0_LACSI|nr:unnamed protein product [Lactuca saligna]